MKKNIIEKVSVSNIAYLIYHSQKLDIPMEPDYEALIHTTLAELNEKLHSKLEYEEAQTIFNIAIDYGEHCSEKCFEEGMKVGVKLLMEILR